MKTINVEDEVWTKLSEMKILWRQRTINEVIKKMIELMERPKQ